MVIKNPIKCQVSPFKALLPSNNFEDLYPPPPPPPPPNTHTHTHTHTHTLKGCCLKCFLNRFGICKKLPVTLKYFDLEQY